ncbi:MAG: hypothetical protein RLZZ410_1598 [Pseudomonadota bacterium]|jgi:hypothetical protein
MNKLFKTFAVIALLGSLTACVTTPVTNADGDSFQDIQTKLLGDMPLPGGATIVHDKSLILGSGDGWAGRVAISSAQNATETFTFFRDQYQKAGWTLVSSTKTKNSILVFIKKDRTATVEIEEGSMLGRTGVMLTVAPRSTVIPPVSK